eukprot:CAMPEP_0171105278 /NCGR_PEP_ID=MMETSP0766_2-20121228/62296_1 /TAXON_ID=439317 /ORGANISM="Gambierdiscus australes, Strain CAWD 149" /LENGTH=331 /DNA_ID=CAMNT_0011566073 /DNA_START=183 /DNA_END=1177 /DNA_ORIENTATION=+
MSRSELVYGLPPSHVDLQPPHITTCTKDEVAGEMMGVAGVVCAPRCGSTSSECPADVPEGSSAQPQCMLSDVDQVGYCGLLCELDSHCPSGSSCWRAAALEAGLCVRPLSFTEWAKQGAQRRKLDFSQSAKVGRNSKSIQLKKAYDALMSLKQRYSMAASDADVLAVEELIATARTAAASAPAPPPSPPVQRLQNSVLDPWRKDVGYLADNLQRGLPGLQREVHDTIWNVEHLERRGVASELLRGVIMIGLVYFLGGLAYNYQVHGLSGMRAVPHVGFWMEYPELVKEGVVIFTQYVSQVLGTSGPTTYAESRPVKRVERDTFTNFADEAL